MSDVQILMLCSMLSLVAFGLGWLRGCTDGVRVGLREGSIIALHAACDVLDADVTHVLNQIEARATAGRTVC